MPGTSPDLPTLLAALHAEARRRAPSDLASLAAPGAPEGPPPPALTAWLFERREALAAWIQECVPSGSPGQGFAEDPAGHLAGEVAAYLLAHNQFLPLDRAHADELEALHARALSALAAALRRPGAPLELGPALARVATAYRVELGEFVARLAPPGDDPVLPALREVVSAEYGPELQLAVLGLDPAQLADPVLDLGCGPSASLVHLLRAQGRQVLGVDCGVAPGPGLLRADWLEVPLPPGRLGTVVSHLGFSLHFVHHHLRPGGDAPRYARRYMEILGSLRPGGLFAYAPGLPFVEEHLPSDRWALERTPVPVPAGRAPLPVPWYASRVRRLR